MAIPCGTSFGASRGEIQKVDVVVCVFKYGVIGVRIIGFNFCIHQAPNS